MKPIDVSPQDLAIVKSILEKHVPEYEVRAFGSRVSWTAKGSSDLDLAVMTDKPLATMRLADLKEEFSESDLPFKVDVVDWAATKEDFRKIIGGRAVTIKNCSSLLANWEERKWGDIAKLEYGKALRNYQDAQGEYPVYGTNGAIGWHNEPLCSHPGIIIGRKGAYRGVHYSSKPFCVIDTAFYLEPKQQLDMKWAYYQLLTHDINSMDSGSAIPSTSRDAFYQLPVRVPPLNTQSAIAQILGSLDDKIELNRRMNETLEATARAIYKSWFVDFDPVKAKMAARKPFGMDEETARLFPSEFEESKVGRIPKGWKFGEIGDISEINARTLNSNESLNEIHYIEISEVMKGEINSIAIYQRGSEPSRARRKLKHGDTVLSTVRPDRQAYFLALHPRSELIASTGFAVVSSNADNWAFLHSALTMPNIFETLGTLADGGAYPAVRPDVVSKLELCIPSEEIIDKYESIAQPLFKLAWENRGEVKNLAKIRDQLLPNLLSGEINLKDAEKFAKVL